MLLAVEVAAVGVIAVVVADVSAGAGAPATGATVVVAGAGLPSGVASRGSSLWNGGGCVMRGPNIPLGCAGVSIAYMV